MPLLQLECGLEANQDFKPVQENKLSRIWDLLAIFHE
jgi:hypothetical protein